MRNSYGFWGWSQWTLAPAVAVSAGNGSRARAPKISPRLLAAADGDPGNESNDTIEVQRRRPSGSSEGQPRERAEAPVRRKPSSGGGTTAPRQQASGGMGARPPTPSGGMPSGGQLNMKSLLIIGALILAFVVLRPMLFGGGSEQTAGLPAANEPSVQPAEPVLVIPTEPPLAVATEPPAQSAAAEPTTAAGASAPGSSSAATPGQKWLVMLYQDADDKILEQDIFVDVNEAERIGSTDRVQIVAQLDRYAGGFQGDGNWTGAKRFYLTQNDDLQRIRSKVVGDLGEVNMSDPRTLVDFVAWAMKNYPADKYVLILSDHGMGWPGGWSDASFNGRVQSSIPLASAVGNNLYLMQLDNALQAIRTGMNLDKFEMIGMDACLMAHLEVLSALAPHARYAVASQETEPSLGWAYTSFLKQLTDNPDMGGADLARAIVQSYIQDDQRIVDDQARADFLSRGSGMEGLYGTSSRVSARQLAQQMTQDVTLTAFDLGQVPALMRSVNDLAYTLQGANQQVVAKARSYAQSFTSIFGPEVPASYIDLGNFALLVKKASGNQAVTDSVDQMMAALKPVVIAEKHGSSKPGANGVSVYFPNSQLYKSPVAGPQSYTAVANRFAKESLWDDFLAFHYTGRSFQPTASTSTGRGVFINAGVGSERRLPVSAPGTGTIEISPIRLSSDVAAPGKPIVLSADVRGQNIGYIYLFVGYLDRASNSIFVADMDYLASPNTQEVQGVYYPDWGDKGRFTLKFTWEPLMFSLTDGKTSSLALFKPQRYGASPEEAIYTVDGNYTFGDSGESRVARLYFSNGVLRQAVGFTGAEEAAAPREIVPNPGDTFTVLERWLDQGESGQPATASTQEGKTLTFGNKTFTWKELDAAAGDYVVGFIVTDLDGNSFEAHADVTVE